MNHFPFSSQGAGFVALLAAAVLGNEDAVISPAYRSHRTVPASCMKVADLGFQSLKAPAEPFS